MTFDTPWYDLMYRYGVPIYPKSASTCTYHHVWYESGHLRDYSSYYVYSSSIKNRAKPKKVGSTRHYTSPASGGRQPAGPSPGAFGTPHPHEPQPAILNASPSRSASTHTLATSLANIAEQNEPSSQRAQPRASSSSPRSIGRAKSNPAWRPESGRVASILEVPESDETLMQSLMLPSAQLEPSAESAPAIGVASRKAASITWSLPPGAARMAPSPRLLAAHGTPLSRSGSSAPGLDLVEGVAKTLAAAAPPRQRSQDSQYSQRSQRSQHSQRSQRSQYSQYSRRNYRSAYAHAQHSNHSNTSSLSNAGPLLARGPVPESKTWTGSRSTTPLSANPNRAGASTSTTRRSRSKTKRPYGSRNASVQTLAGSFQDKKIKKKKKGKDKCSAATVAAATTSTTSTSDTGADDNRSVRSRLSLTRPRATVNRLRRAVAALFRRSEARNED